ncbi:hypothetical protein [Phycicoccus sp. Soil748]|uniref:PGAP1-like alpha/beta domain-containing protein n=1 Tax=Phycicoccus sp. Soil748 TaxID=1736397 RepID=UPI0007023DB6|nr:hypothetical protein [Phycicoccus sp. Soil748]KRE58650.1 hypothetical protein ASG70_17945 [Phycicoccus sp. Soil748]
MSDGGLRVRGGVGGTTVGLAALEEASGRLAGSAQDIAASLARTLLVAADPGLAGVAPAVVTAAAAEGALALAVGPAGLAGDAARLVGLVTATAATVSAYRAVDAEVARTVALTQDAVMFVVGSQAPELAVGVLALEALGVDVGGALDRAVWEVPAVADLAGGAEGLVAGLRSDPLTAPLLTPGAAADAEGPGGPRTYEDALAVLADSAAVWGLLDDSGPVHMQREPAGPSGASAPRSLEELVRGQGPLSDPADHPGRIRVVEVPTGTGPVWLVEVSGTQVWDPRTGANPCDVTTDVRAMAQESTALARGVQEALDQAQAESRAGSDGAGSGGTGSGAAGPASAGGPGRDASTEPVMLVGHSLGGIVAAGLASSPAFTARHRVTHVVTAGSPVARMPVPAGVQVLSLEHHQDPVPRLEGAPNPDRSGWVTATRDLDDGRDGTGSEAHGVGEYAATAAAVDRSTDPSLVAWRDGSEAFFHPAEGAQVVVRDYRIARGAP